MAAAPNMPTSLTQADRRAKTRELLAAAASRPEERQALLLRAAALNIDAALAIVSSLYLRYPHAADDEERLAAFAQEVYLRAVLVIDPSSATDLLSDVLPALRAGVVAFGRGEDTSP